MAGPHESSGCLSFDELWIRQIFASQWPGHWGRARGRKGLEEMKLMTELAFDGRHWRRINHLAVASSKVSTVNYDDRDQFLEDDPRGIDSIDIRLVDAHQIVATLFLGGYMDFGRGTYHYRFPSGTRIRWGPHGWEDPHPCHSWSYDPPQRMVRLHRLQLVPWQNEYDVLVLGNPPGITLADGEWTCQLEDNTGGITHGTVLGPKRSPEDFVGRVELFLSATYGRRISIPWMGLHGRDRISRGGYDTSDPVYVRTVAAEDRGPSKRHHKNFKNYMDTDKAASDYFVGFCRALHLNPRLAEFIMEWLVLQDATRARPILVDAFTTLRTIILSRHPSPKGDGVKKPRRRGLHSLVRADIPPDWTCPPAVVEWMEANDIKDRTWYGAFCELRNRMAHREYFDMEYRIIHAVSQMSYDVIDRLGHIIWQQIQYAGAAE